LERVAPSLFLSFSTWEASRRKREKPPVLKRGNPYTPAPGASLKILAGGDRDLDNFRARIERLMAGGTAAASSTTACAESERPPLITEFDGLVGEAGWATTEAQEVGAAHDFSLTFGRMAARLLREMSRRHRLKQRVEQALAVMKAFSLGRGQRQRPERPACRSRC
jgi:hypothetical protein